MATTSLASVLASFARLSPEDQTAARTALAITAAPREQSEASLHYVNADLPCTIKGADCKDKEGAVRTFRTVKGQTWHAENVKHA